MERKERLEENFLIVRAQMGDSDAFSKLFERYHGRLTYYIRRFLDSEEQVKDVLQSVWLDVFRQLPGLRHNEAFRVWLYRIAHNKAVRAFKEYQRYVSLEEENIQCESTKDDSEFTSEDAAQIHAALNRLEPHHKEVLVLRFLESMSYQEIADVIGCNLGTIRSRIHYAKKSLRKEMEEQNDE